MAVQLNPGQIQGENDVLPLEDPPGPEDIAQIYEMNLAEIVCCSNPLTMPMSHICLAPFSYCMAVTVAAGVCLLAAGLIDNDSLLIVGAGGMFICGTLSAFLGAGRFFGRDRICERVFPCEC